MAELTLREVCEMIGVSRRAVQGYEHCGLVAPTGKTARGYLLYDEEAQEKIRKIRQYQDYGFQVKEIGELFAAPPEEKLRMMNEKLKELVRKRKKIDGAMVFLAIEITNLEHSLRTK